MAIFKIVLGAHVIHATYSRVIIDTGKHSISDAKAYIDYVIRQVRIRPMFKGIDMRVRSSFIFFSYA